MLDTFHPLVRRWFERRFGDPTEPQALGWPEIAARRDVLVSAPTGSGKTLAAFLLVLTAGAITVDAIFTGKTWCNYVCPVLFVEKLYTEPRGLRETPNSQCGTCTACRPTG